MQQKGSGTSSSSSPSSSSSTTTTTHKSAKEGVIRNSNGSPNYNHNKILPLHPSLDAAHQGKNEYPNVDLEFERADLTRTSSLEDLTDYHAEELEKYKRQLEEVEQPNQRKGYNAVQAPWKYFLGVKLHKKQPKKYKKDKRRNSSDGDVSSDSKVVRSGRAHTTNATHEDDNIKDNSSGETQLSKSMEERRIVDIKSNAIKTARGETERITTPLLHIPSDDVKPLLSAGCFMEVKCCRDEALESFADIAAARSVNLYPVLADSQQKLADPICDYFRCQLFQNRVIAAVADGCGWGFASATAALLAVNSFVCFLNHNQHFINDLRSAGESLLDALTCAHERILYGFSNAQMFQVGTTTICGGMLLELANEGESSDSSDEDELKYRRHKDTKGKGKGKEKEKETKRFREEEWESDSDADVSGDDKISHEQGWVFICASIGDCKAIYYSAQDHALHTITAKGRSKAIDQRDPGGRLGPHNGAYADRRPDLRNLGVYSVRCSEGDVIILLSDGIYDNFDPQLRGLSPKDLGLPVDSWAAADNSTVEHVKERYMLDHMLEVICPNEEAILRPDEVVSRLTDSCQQLLEKSVNFMEENPDEALPQDYALYPGKMDHATSLAFLVGRNEFCSFRRVRR